MATELQILNPGPQATLQARGRHGMRHLGIPFSGPADALSHALANKLVGNPLDAPGIEVTLGPFEVKLPAGARFALTGAIAPAMLHHRAVAFHRAHDVDTASILKIHVPRAGARIYLSLAGKIDSESFLNSRSTYLPAGFGGFKGRALRAGDTLSYVPSSVTSEAAQTPQALRMVFRNTWTFRASDGPNLTDGMWDRIYGQTYRATNRADRTGVELTGDFPVLDATDLVRPSSGVWPGTLQLPKGGKGFLLLADAQTTGGYPHILQVNRSDRHLLGQIRPGDRLQFVRTSPEQAAANLEEAMALIRTWLPGFTL